MSGAAPELDLRHYFDLVSFFMIRHDPWTLLLHSSIQVILALIYQVSEELIRVAILWHELWHEGLEEASRLYFSEGNVKGMFAALEPLHQMMEKGPQTLKETSFNQVCSSAEA